ncbi:MAG: SBBP repeat-containing protein [Flavobacteriales bacterium]|jgi:hypothetical protein|nr:SBBP repeat-containing protein [Flavobacteriales bacterium]
MKKHNAYFLKTTLLILLSTGVFVTNAQIFEWATSFGQNSNDGSKSVAVDAAGNVYTTGFFQGTVDFDPGPGTYNLSSFLGNDIFIQKLDANGNFIWAKTFGGSGEDYGTSITTDASGNVYTTGIFYNTVDFDPGAGIFDLDAVGSDDIFVQKLDANGNFLWAVAFGGTSIDAGQSITLDAAGNIYTTGSFRSTVDFDPGTGTDYITSNGNEDVFVQKLDANGNFLWAKAFGGTGPESAQSIAVDATGNAYTTGRFVGTVDFDPGAANYEITTSNNRDIFVHKLDSSGNFLWAKTFGSAPINDVGESVVVDASGNIYATGNFQGTVDFDSGSGTFNLTSNGSRDAFVLKLDPSGNFLWAKTLGGSSNDYGHSLAVDVSGNIYTFGLFEGTSDFDPGTGTYNLTSTGFTDIFVQKMNPSGNFQWAVSLGGNLYDIAQSIDVDLSGNMYITGYFEGTPDFDPGTGTFNLSSNGGRDVFVQKMSQCSSMGIDTQVACGTYTWIDGNTYTSSNNTATDTLINAAGCDSVVTLNLTINTVSDITTTTSGLTITANNANATYQWIDCSDNSEIIGETGQSFTSSVNGNYAVIITEGNCSDTSDCVSIYTNGIDHLAKTSLSVFPNPSSGVYEVNGTANENATVYIYDMNGKLVQSFETVLKTFTVDLTTMENGIYQLVYTSNSSISRMQLLKR